MRQTVRPTNGRESGPHKGQRQPVEPASAVESARRNASVSNVSGSRHSTAVDAPQTEPYAGSFAGVTTAELAPLTEAEAESAARTVRDERLKRTAGVSLPIEIPSLPPAPRSPARLTPVVLVLMQMLLDVAAAGGAFGTAYLLRFSQQSPQTLPTDAPYTIVLAMTVMTIIVTFYFSGLYNLKRGASRVDEFYKTATAVSMGTVLSLAANSLVLGDTFNYSRQVLLTGWVLTILFVTTLRVSYNVLLGELRKRGVDRARVLIVGAGPTAQAVEARLRYHSALGYHVVGMVESTNAELSAPVSASRVPVLGTLPMLPALVRKHKVDEVIVALSGASDKHFRDILDLIQDESASVKIYPDAFQLMTQNEVSVGELSGLPLLSVKDVALRGWNRRVKRAFDVVFSLLALVLTSPLMLLIALAIKFSSPGPVFFIQERVGLDGKPFPLVKFRTMRIIVGAGEMPILAERVPSWTVRNDPRRTSIGTFLRRFSLDELPQFYNVLVGEMSVVGPRPEQPAYVQEFAQRIPKYLLRHREKAGITGWAQVNGMRGDSSIEMRTKMDLYYIENWSVLFDLKIIVRTMVAMFRGKNAY